MAVNFVDFRLTQESSNTQLLTLAQDASYPSYEITLHVSSDKILPSLVSSSPDVSFSHRSYLASCFAEVTFHKYRNGASIKYPETGVRIRDGDVTTTVEDVLPMLKQSIQCQSLAEKQYSLEFDLGNGVREQCRWHPPPINIDPNHMLELRRVEERSEGEEAFARILRRDWDNFKNDLVAVVRVRDDLMDEHEEGRRGIVDQILVSAVALAERLRRRHQYMDMRRAW